MSETKRSRIALQLESIIHIPEVANCLIPFLPYKTACIVIGGLNKQFNDLQPLISTLIVIDSSDDLDTVPWFFEPKNPPYNIGRNNITGSLHEITDMLRYNVFLDKLHVIDYGWTMWIERGRLWRWPQGHKSKGRKYSVMMSDSERHVPLSETGHPATDMVLSKSVTYIEDYALQMCPKLENVSMMNTSLTYIGPYALQGCPLLHVDIRNTPIETISHSVFKGCLNLQTVDMSNTPLKNIGHNAFEKCKKLISVNISNTSLETMGHNAFAKCKNLINVNISNTPLKIIEDCVFYECTSLEFIDLSQTEVESIWYEAFRGCVNLQRVIFPASLKQIRMQAFRDTRLESIDLYNTMVESIGYRAFCDCCPRTVIFPASLKEIKREAFNSNALTRIDLSHTQIQFIEDKAFSYCYNLEHVVLPSSLTNIRKQSFTDNETEFIHARR